MNDVPPSKTSSMTLGERVAFAMREFGLCDADPSICEWIESQTDVNATLQLYNLWRFQETTLAYSLPTLSPLRASALAGRSVPVVTYLATTEGFSILVAVPGATNQTVAVDVIGEHVLRVTAHGEKDYGAEITVRSAIADIAQSRIANGLLRIDAMTHGIHLGVE